MSTTEVKHESEPEASMTSSDDEQQQHTGDSVSEDERANEQQQPTARGAHVASNDDLASRNGKQHVVERAQEAIDALQDELRHRKHASMKNMATDLAEGSDHERQRDTTTSVLQPRERVRVTVDVHAKPCEASSDETSSALPAAPPSPIEMLMHKMHELVQKYSPTTSDSVDGDNHQDADSPASETKPSELEQLKSKVEEQGAVIQSLSERDATYQVETEHLRKSVLALQQDLIRLMNIVELQMQMPPVQVPILGAADFQRVHPLHEYQQAQHQQSQQQQRQQFEAYVLHQQQCRDISDAAVKPEQHAAMNNMLNRRFMEAVERGKRAHDGMLSGGPVAMDNNSNGSSIGKERHLLVNLLDSTQPLGQAPPVDPAPRNAAVPCNRHVELKSQVERILQQLRTLDTQFEAVGVENQSVWICKPSNLSQGRGIQLLTSLDDILALQTTQDSGNEGIAGDEDQSSPSLAPKSKWVVQKYMEQPLLSLQGGRKFDIRQWVLISSLQPLRVFWYHKCYLRFCSEPFGLERERLDDQFVHLSNFSIQKNAAVATAAAAAAAESGDETELEAEMMWSSDRFQDHLRQEHGGDVWNEVIVPQMQHATRIAILSTVSKLKAVGKGFEWLGLDFLLDASHRVWLLEVNVSPDVSHSTSVTAELVPQATEHLLQLVLDEPLAPGNGWLPLTGFF
ncbi:hypothetical protein Gpo141_00001133 [Globisporangium polare]